MNQNQCNRCGLYFDDDLDRCPVDQVPLKPTGKQRKRFKLTPEKIKYIRVLAKVQKGLDDEDYHAELKAATGLDSTKDIRRRRQFVAIVSRLNELPDVPGREHRRAA